MHIKPDSYASWYFHELFFVFVLLEWYLNVHENLIVGVSDGYSNLFRAKNYAVQRTKMIFFWRSGVLTNNINNPSMKVDHQLVRINVLLFLLRSHRTFVQEKNITFFLDYLVISPLIILILSKETFCCVYINIYTKQIPINFYAKTFILWMDMCKNSNYVYPHWEAPDIL